AETFNVFNLKVKAGYHPQYARNTLQLNRGNGRFSEIGYLAGVYATDWSWAPLFADLDNDGRKDLFITNGIYRRPNDLDYINYVGNDAVQASLADGITRNDLALLAKMPQIPLANFAYRNNGNLTFANMAEAWGLAQPGFSNGAVYADLNNSGALDLIVNNVNAPASIYRNRASEIGKNHYLTVVLRGSGANTAGIGTKVIIRQGATTQLVEQMPTRGFQSSVDPRLHFGLGPSAQIDSLTVVWPDRRYQVLVNVPADRLLTLSQDDAAGRYDYRKPEASPPLFDDVTGRVAIDFKHEENVFFDYNREPLMPHLLSAEGPALAVADVNGDGLDDLYAGGAKWQAGRLLIQQANGRFQVASEPAFRTDSISEDADAAFLDANGDGHPDLYVVSAGNEFSGKDEQLRDRLYMNDGRGNFSRANAALPDFFENGSCVVPADFNGDGHVDLFVGSRVVSRAYGLIPRSHLLQNDGAGHFVDVTVEKAPSLSEAGMVSSAVWIDYDDDGRLDLVVAGEWMPVRLFHQEQGKFVERTKEAGLSATSGWWNSVAAADLNGDHRADLVLGNLGLNSYIRATRDEPARLFVHDFFDNGTVEQILTFYKKGVSYPLAGRDEMLRMMPQLRSKFLTYASFGASRVEDIFAASELKKAAVLEARLFASSIALNNGKGAFEVQPLPIEAQFAPVYAILAEDFDGDRKTDLLLAGNFYGVTPVRGRYDASYGTLLRGDGNGQFHAVGSEETALRIDGQARDMKWLRRAGGERLIAIARNNDRLQLLKPLLSSRATSH
ncbi:MAG: VCBS repeat-containing protein, partial [Gemmatimonadales bacterium]